MDGIESMKLGLTGCSVDLDPDRGDRGRLPGEEGMLAADLIGEATAILAKTTGEVLPGWEQIENEVNGGRGAASEFVAELRRRADSVSNHDHGAWRQSIWRDAKVDRAIPLLERDREDLARNRRAAHRENGQSGPSCRAKGKHARGLNRSPALLVRVL